MGHRNFQYLIPQYKNNSNGKDRNDKTVLLVMLLVAQKHTTRQIMGRGG